MQQSTSSQPVPPTAVASGIPYERLVKLFQVVQERASKASAADMLSFLQEDLSASKYTRLSPSQRERMQHTLRSMQEYALEVWRLSPHHATQSAGATPFSLSGVYAAIRADSGAFVLQNLAQPGSQPLSGSFVPVATPTPTTLPTYRNPDSGLIALFAGPPTQPSIPALGAPSPVSEETTQRKAMPTATTVAAVSTLLPETNVTGAYEIVSAKSINPVPQKNIFRRAWEGICTAFGRSAAASAMPIPREAGE